MKIIELDLIINKNNENLRIPYDNHESYESFTISQKNYKNQFMFYFKQSTLF